MLVLFVLISVLIIACLLCICFSFSPLITFVFLTTCFLILIYTLLIHFTFAYVLLCVYIRDYSIVVVFRPRVIHVADVCLKFVSLIFCSSEISNYKTINIVKK